MKGGDSAEQSKIGSMSLLVLAEDYQRGASSLFSFSSTFTIPGRGESEVEDRPLSDARIASALIFHQPAERVLAGGVEEGESRHLTPPRAAGRSVSGRTLSRRYSSASLPSRGLCVLRCRGGIVCSHSCGRRTPASSAGRGSGSLRPFQTFCRAEV